MELSRCGKPLHRQRPGLHARPDAHHVVRPEVLGRVRRGRRGDRGGGRFGGCGAGCRRSSSDGFLEFIPDQADKTAVADAAQWLKEQDVCTLTLFNGAPLSVTPPNFVELEIVETDPGVRGDTASGGNKPARLSTGAVVKVPLFIEQGEVIRVDTRSGEYVSRVKAG